MYQLRKNNFALSLNDTTAIKGIAIIAMICHHFFLYQPDWVDRYPYWLELVGTLGKVCVSLFLFCSGYGMSIQYSKMFSQTKLYKEKIIATIVFIIKRFIKFYSGYWFVFLVFVPVTIICFDRPLSEVYGEHTNILKRLFFDLLGIQGYQSYNITWWFNKLIILLYLCFPLLYLFIRKTKLCGLIISFIIMFSFDGIDGLNYFELYFWQFPFVLGIGWNIYQNKLLKLSNLIYKYQVLFKVCILVLLLLASLQRLFNIIPWIHFSGIRVDGILSVIIALVCLIILKPYKKLYDVLIFLGIHSMNIYLIHTFFNGYWKPIHAFLHTNAYMRITGLNVFVLILICLIVSIVIEFIKDKICWNKITQDIIKYINYHTIK